MGRLQTQVAPGTPARVSPLAARTAQASFFDNLGANCRGGRASNGTHPPGFLDFRLSAQQIRNRYATLLRSRRIIRTAQTPILAILALTVFVWGLEYRLSVYQSETSRPSLLGAR